MNNGEHLNTLSNEEKAKALAQRHILYLLDWLNSPHETTADEDFLLHNLCVKSYNDNEWRYMSKNRNISDIELVITRTETKLRIMPSREVVFVNLEENEIRKIAEKKRKEMGWGE
jgi:hypothetical protein